VPQVAMAETDGSAVSTAVLVATARAGVERKLGTQVVAVPLTTPVVVGSTVLLASAVGQASSLRVGLAQLIAVTIALGTIAGWLAAAP